MYAQKEILRKNICLIIHIIHIIIHRSKVPLTPDINEHRKLFLKLM